MFAFDYEELLGFLLAAVVCLAALALSLQAPTHADLQSIRECAKVSENIPRLACYDALAISHTTPRRAPMLHFAILNTPPDGLKTQPP